MSILDRALRLGEGRQFKQYAKRVDRINAWEPELELLEDDELREAADALRERAQNGESLDELLPETFALVREVSKRRLGMRHFDVQLIGGMVLHDGAIAEMKTGEGKTLTATLAVVLNSLAGRGVHVVTVNDYLARRDAMWMKPIYDMLGVTVGVLQNMQPYEEKRAAYAADVTYGTNSEFGIDHLRRAENGHLVNHLIQALKAESLYKRDVDYAVIDGEVKIIDEFTGRILEGRRWSEGLHQAVEAKEGVRARVENDRELVLAAGGLFICGTERHESRRIDNQLRGRSGRQGDPGESRFFLSAEDDLVRLFAGDKIYKILDRLGTTDDEGNEEPIEAGMLTKQIEKAQRKVEEQHFLMRKHTLEYDDVMNEQRRIIYEYRDDVLEGRDMGDAARDEIGSVVRRIVDEHTPGDYVEEWDLDGLFVALDDIWPTTLTADQVTAENLDREELIERLTADAVGLYDRREAELGSELMRALERYLLLQIIDNRWREHLYDMDYLREGIHLRGFAQIEPIVAYKNEAFELFTDLMNSIWSDFSRMIFHVEVEVQAEDGEVPDEYLTPSGGSGARQVQYSA